MRRKNISNVIIRESITQALLILMQEKPFTQISISEIVQKAGVSRVSFYRNFQSRENVLVTKLNEEAMLWWERFNKAQRRDYVLGVFEHVLTVREIVLLLYEQQLSHLLLQNINDLLGPAADEAALPAYQKACLAGCVFGVLHEWVKRGMTDSPEAMSRIFSSVQLDALVAEIQR